MTILNEIGQFSAFEISQNRPLYSEVCVDENSNLPVSAFDRPFVEGWTQANCRADGKSNEEIRHTMLESIIDSKGSSSNLHWSASLILFVQQELTAFSVNSDTEVPITMRFLVEQGEKSTLDSEPYYSTDSELGQTPTSKELKTENSALVQGTPDRMIFKLKHLTGFDWGELGSLLNVGRKTLVDWMQGKAVSEESRRHIEKTLEAIKSVDRGTSEMNSVELKRKVKGLDPFTAIQNGNYSLAKELMGVGMGRPEIDESERGWIGDYRPMLEHNKADGTEEPPLPLTELKPATRRRTVRRA